MAREQGSALLQEGRYAEAETLLAGWQASHPGDADAVYQLALARALLGKTLEARAGFVRALALDPARVDARFELAVTYIRTGDYRTALSWVSGGLCRAPANEYGNELAGTALYLSGAKEESLRYWNRLNRPHLSEIRISTTSGLSRQVIANEIDLAPGDLLSLAELRKARWRLSQHPYLREVVFEPIPGATPDEYALRVAADARQGLGTPVEFLVNTFGDASFRTLHFDYSNIRGSTITLSARWRWTGSASLLQGEVNVPRLAHRPLYSVFTFTRRDETWTLPESVTAYRLRMQEFGVRTTIPLGVPNLSIVAAVAGRDRRLSPLARGASESRAGGGGPSSATTGTLWLSGTPRLAFRSAPLAGEWNVRTHVRAGVEAGLNRGGVARGVSRFSLSPEVRVERGRDGDRRQSVIAGVTAGTASRSATLEDSFVLGAGPDAQYPLRAHPFLVGGHPGSAPLARRFLLANVTASTRVHRWSWLNLGLVGFLDYARIFTAYPGQRFSGALLDTGLGLELGAPLGGGRPVTLMWGRDLAGHRSRLYLSVGLR